MRRSEFQEEVTCFDELIDWCCEEGCDVCEEIYSQESYDDWINESLADMARNEYWQDMRDTLNDLPEGYEYYCRDENDGEWYGISDRDFSEYFERALEWGDDNEVWEEETTEEEPEPVQEEDDEPIVEIEIGMSFEDLFASCNNEVQRISKDAETQKHESDAAANMVDAAIDKFVDSITAMVEGMA